MLGMAEELMTHVLPAEDGPSPRKAEVAFDNGDYIVPVEGTTSMPYPAETSLQGTDHLHPEGSLSQEQQQLLSRWVQGVSCKAHQPDCPH